MRKQLLCAMLTCALLLTGCADVSEPSKAEPACARQEIFAMDTYMTLTAYGDNAQEAVDAAAAEITRLDTLWSVGSPESEISQLNQKGSAVLSSETADVVERALSLSQESGGAFDITIYPLMELWGFTSGDYRVPTAAEISEKRSHVDSSALTYDHSSRSLSLPDGMSVDLGGIAKGYTSSRVMEVFRDYGVASGMVSLGGNVQLCGTKPDGGLWRVGIENPDESVVKSDMVGVLSVADKAVITSGGYERYFEEDGVCYHHILNPKSGYPAQNGLISVTIVSEDGTLADALSTALFVMGKESALELWRSHADSFDAVLVEEDGTITVTTGLADAFTSELSFEIAD